MKKCWKCGGIAGERAVHHINGNNQDDNPTNKIRLCPTCHDLVEGTCAKCQIQDECHNRKFRSCWRFDDALPPIDYKERVGEENPIKPDIWRHNLEKRLWDGIYCLECGEQLVEVGTPKPDCDYICGLCVVEMCSGPSRVVS